MDSRPTLAEINLSALKENLAAVKSAAGDNCGILAVVKADAYGHGFMDVATLLDSEGVTAFGVAFLAEGIQLRKSGIDRPILILGGIYPGQEKKCVGFNLATTVFSLEQARFLDSVAGRLYRKAKIHVKIDTGMGRLGIFHADSGRFFSELRKMKNLDLEGVISHFSSSDELNIEGISYTDDQSKLFENAVIDCRNNGFDPRYIHIANSAALFSRSLPFCNLARPGIVLYGALPSNDFVGRINVKPVMRLVSRVAMLKWVDPGRSISYARRYKTSEKRLIASIPVGYADGYPRSLTNCADVLIRGHRAPVVGTICMDWFMADVTDVTGISLDDEVTLMGCDRDGNCIRAEELAEKAGTIPYEIFCGISKRVPRVYCG